MAAARQEANDIDNTIEMEVDREKFGYLGQLQYYGYREMHYWDKSTTRQKAMKYIDDIMDRVLRLYWTTYYKVSVRDANRLYGDQIDQAYALCKERMDDEKTEEDYRSDDPSMKHPMSQTPP